MKILKSIWEHMFTIDKKLKRNTKKNKRFELIFFRFLLLIVFSPIIYVLLFGYFGDGFSIVDLIKTICLILLFRFFFKEWTDTMIFIFFHKKSYKIDDSLKYTRKRKLRKLKFKNLFRL